MTVGLSTLIFASLCAPDLRVSRPESPSGARGCGGPKCCTEPSNQPCGDALVAV